MKNKPTLLIVDDNAPLLSSWKRALQRDFEVFTAANVEDTLKQFRRKIDIALVDIRLDEVDEDNKEGVLLLQRFRELQPDLPVVMVSGYGDVNVAVECMRLGAMDFVEKKAGLPEIKERLFRAFQVGRTSRTVKHLSDIIDQKEPVEFVGQSPRVAELNRVIEAVAQDGYISVLIRGETGTGKELVARSIYRRGWRYGEPFVAAPVVSFPETLLESELFGHEAGAFTDAKKRKIGWIEKADGGVLFLDEIGDLPMEVQVKLLRFLEERQFSRVGSTEQIKVDVQVVSATHQDLEKAIAEQRFREDLYYRLKGMQVDLPQLQERKEDIPLLADYFLEHFRKQGRTRLTTVSKDALEAMKLYPWPGNVRELRTAIERAILFAGAHAYSQIEKDDLPGEIVISNQRKPIPEEPTSFENFDLSQQLAREELRLIEAALKKAQGKKSVAYILLGLNDRFALRRRVNTLFEKFPGLVDEFVYIKKLF